MPHFDYCSLADNHSALQRIAQLTDIAGPGIILECQHHGIAYHPHLAAVLLVHLFEEMRDQFRDVGLVIAQRRERDIENVQAIKKVLAQLALGDCLLGNLVGGREHTHVYRCFHLTAQAAQLAVFQHAQQLGLRGCRHFADLIQQ